MEWANVRLPRALRERIRRLSAEMLASHRAGHMQLPSSITDTGVPAWFVIETALDEWESKRKRGRRAGRGKRRMVREARSPRSDSEGSMYTPIVERRDVA